MSRLLSIAAWWCGERATALVFQPLLADWQHDLQQAKQIGQKDYIIAVLSGTFAYARSMVRCTMTAHGWLPTSRAAQIVALTFFCAFDAAIFLLWIAALPFGQARDMSSPGVGVCAAHLTGNARSILFDV